MEGETLGLAHYWAQADGVIRATAWLLLAMSVLSWCVIVAKAWQALSLRRLPAALNEFWREAEIESAIARLKPVDGERLAVPLAAAALRCAQAEGGQSLAAQLGPGDAALAALREALGASQRRLESGLSWLASIGATAPFIGLFGTVWGIYHALIEIAASGQIQLAQVAGPVGEALVMTAAGLAVAIPAVLAYNAFLRLQRGTGARLEGFARDLHSWVLERERSAAARQDG